MVTFQFKDIGENLGTRVLGNQIRQQLLALIDNNDKVVLDFEGVEIVSNSFADESIGKLLLSMSLDELKRHTTFKGTNEFIRKNIAIALKRRIETLSNN